MKVNYETAFYQTVDSNAATSAAVLVPVILQHLKPSSIIDVGCGPGGWLAEFRKHGIEDILGVDGPWVDPALLKIPKDRFRIADLSQPIEEDRRFDLVVSLETAEHLPPESAETFVHSLTRLGSIIVFSAAVPFQGGNNHFNEQWPDYWSALFEARGYTLVDALRPVVWTNPNIEWWYAQNSFFVVDRARLSEFPRLCEAAAKTRSGQLSVVHPRAYVENAARAKRPTELVQATLGSIKRSLQRKRRRT